jgi:hypothetical protein
VAPGPGEGASWRLEAEVDPLLTRHLFGHAHEIGAGGDGYAVADLPGSHHEVVGDVLPEPADDAPVGGPAFLVAKAPDQLLDQVLLAEGEGVVDFGVGLIDLGCLGTMLRTEFRQPSR